MCRAYPLFRLLWVLIGFVWLIGCAPTGTYVTRICQSESGDLVAFSTYPGDDVWAVTREGFLHCGHAPFEISASGSLIAAVRYQPQVSLVITAVNVDGHETVGIDLHESCCLCENVFVDEISFQKQGVSVAYRRQSAPASKPVSCFVVVPSRLLLQDEPKSGEPEFRCRPLETVCRNDAENRYCEYKSSSGITIIEATPSSTQATVSVKRTSEGSSQVLLREPLGAFLSRSLARSGFQYP